MAKINFKIKVLHELIKKQQISQSLHVGPLNWIYVFVYLLRNKIKDVGLLLYNCTDKHYVVISFAIFFLVYTPNMLVLNQI